MNYYEDTICSIITPQGNGAVSVIRISGSKTIEIGNKIFFSEQKPKSLFEQKPNTIHYGIIKKKNKIIDGVLLSIFKNPRSYTGEDVIEISCHASEYIQQEILQLILSNGARIADPGEFTLRAFLNKKLDLSQAEAVADLIASKSETSHKTAMQQLRGGFSHELSSLRNQLVQLISLIELELDFSEEDVEFADRDEIKQLTQKIDKIICQLTQSFELGNVIKNGVPVAIIGKPNVGKSTLLNKILKEEKAIVSDISGTTRDSIEDTLNINGILFRFIDTAGIRETTDTIEKLGIERTYAKIDNAAIILLVVDAADSLSNILSTIRKIKIYISEKNKKLVTVINKSDKLDNKELTSKFAPKAFNKNGITTTISAKNETNITKLENQLTQMINTQKLDQGDTIITNVRHFSALSKASEATKRVLNGIENNISTDLLAQDIKEILYYIGEITGEITNDEILGNIFKNFCIGK